MLSRNALCPRGSGKKQKHCCCGLVRFQPRFRLSFIIDPVFRTEFEGLPLGEIGRQELRRIDELLNPDMANFFRIEDCAMFYQAVMGVLKQSIDLLPLTYRVFRYESVVEDLESEAHGLLSFLALDWDDGVLSFQDTARKKLIRTPSASQVIRPIYNDALNRWRRYERYFEPVKDMLDPLVDEFGYSDS